MDTNEKKNEELHSRRQFFKRAAKATIPILGAILIANIPFVATASESQSQSGCNHGSFI